MKKTTILSLVALLVAAMAAIPSCSNDKNDPKPEEFVADDNSFSGFMSWSLDATNQGPDPALGTAHGGNDSTVTRRIYYKDGQDPQNGKYPVGTIIVKHSSNTDGTVNEFTALVKRGNNFNPNNNDWEWFMLMEDGTIATDPSSGMKMRGATLMNGMCGSCHSQAAAKDFVFSK